ncbi:MAG TPA: hypothetical protein DCQ31_00805 [Bacteroidales bacterium]|nr:hypothetical protein [Bacteroidales bacterium]
MIREKFLDFKYHQRNHLFNLLNINDYIIFTSASKVLAFNKNLELILDIRDEIEKNVCSEYALHKFNVEFSKDTLLFKVLIIERFDFKHNKRFKKIYKDYEFIIGKNKIECNNCDTCVGNSWLFRTVINR